MDYKRRKIEILSLQKICCKEIARHGMIGRLKEILHIIPMNVTEYFLCILNMEQFAEFHNLFPLGAKEERLFIEKYTKYNRTHAIWGAIPRESASEFEFCCQKHWCHAVAKVIASSGIDQGNVLMKLSTKVAKYVKQLHFYAAMADTISVDQLCSFPNVQYIVCSTTQLKTTRKMFEFAEKCKHLRTIKFVCITCRPDFLNCFSRFLKCKANENESVILKFSQMHIPVEVHQNWIFELKEEIHAIKGMNIDGQHIFPYQGQRWLRFYSQARHIDELVLRDVKNVSTVLSDITSNAPPRNDNLALSKLSLYKIGIEHETLASLQHWRFGRLEQFCMWSVPLCYKGTLALAQHATFWPFVKKVVLNRCKLTTNGLLRLLPAMVHQTGCQNLELFHISHNKIKKRGLALIANFLRSNNMTNLKQFHMQQPIFHHDQHTSLFIESFRSTTFIEIDLGSYDLSTTHEENILRAIFSKSNPQLKFLRLGKKTYISNVLLELEQKFLNTF